MSTQTESKHMCCVSNGSHLCHIGGQPLFTLDVSQLGDDFVCVVFRHLIVSKRKQYSVFVDQLYVEAEMKQI